MTLSAIGLLLATISPVKPSFAVNVVGNGPPVILIPGLSCGPEGVWDTTVEHLKAHYKCYVLTLPGFGGQAPIPAPILPTVRDEIEAYVQDNHLAHPIVIGHSLGGFMALWLASHKPDMFAGAVAVDGVPYFSALVSPTATPTNMATMANALRTQFATLTQAQFVVGNHSSLEQMITDPKDIQAVEKQSDLSNPLSVGEAMAEMMETDLRPEMPKITCPTLVYMSGASYSTPAALNAMKAIYEGEIKAVPNHRLAVAEKSRHFIMLDAPDFYFAELDRFLGSIH